jgi:hypothetical protein
MTLRQIVSGRGCCVVTLLTSGIVCFVFCFGEVTAPKKTPPVNSFCTVYNRQIITAEDYEAIKDVPRSVRDRMQANDLYYLCKCKGWDGPECQKMGTLK